MTWRDATVLIPTLNEAESIGDLLEYIEQHYPSLDIIVIDDHSDDGTQKIVKTHKGVVLIERTGARGLTASILDGAKEVATPFFVVIDGDFQHPPEKIGELILALRGGADVAIGTRTKVVGPWPFYRKIMSKIATVLARRKLNQPVSDPLSGFFGVQTSLFLEAKSEKFVPEGYKVLFDYLRAAGELNIQEIAYTFGERRRGKSKIGARHVRAFTRSLGR